MLLSWKALAKKEGIHFNEVTGILYAFVKMTHPHRLKLYAKMYYLCLECRQMYTERGDYKGGKRQSLKSIVNTIISIEHILRLRLNQFESALYRYVTKFVTTRHLLLTKYLKKYILNSTLIPYSNYSLNGYNTRAVKK